LSDKKHVQKRWQFKRAERQAKITQRLDKLNKKSGLLKQLASGAFAAVVSRSFVAPLDLIKVRIDVTVAVACCRLCGQNLVSIIQHLSLCLLADWFASCLSLQRHD
jgi:hypothetical protein